jgi:protein-S-isoprenylcysteine O-methyltransferase Ste14
MNTKHFLESLMVHTLFAGAIVSMFIVATTVLAAANILSQPSWIIWATFCGLGVCFGLLVFGWVDAIQTTNQLYRISRMEERRRHANYTRALYHMRDAVRDHDREVASWEQQVRSMGKRL